MTVGRSFDLRLAVPAMACWAAAAVVCGLEPGQGLAAAVTGGTVFALATVCSRLRWTGGAAGVATGMTMGAALGVALGAASAALHVSIVHSGVVATAARAGHAHAEVVVRLTRDPVRRIGHRGTPFVLADATVTTFDGRPTRAPVLVIAHGSGWDGLLPGQALRLRARVAAPRAGDDVAAVLLTTGRAVRVGRAPWWQRAAGAVRARLRAACSGLPSDARGLVPGLVVGDVSAMPADLTDAFRVSGLTHLNAVSGENCAIVLATVGALVRRTPLHRGARLAVSGISLAAFVALARPSPSVLRAATMGGVALLAAAIGRRTQPLPLLSSAVLALVLVDPFLARSVGFALSVVATAAIVLVAPRWTEVLARRLPRGLAVAVAVPAAAQVACTPLLVLVFGQLTPWAVAANLLAAPAVAPATILGIVAALVATVSVAFAALLAWLAAAPATWLALVARSLAALPGARAGWQPGAALLVCAVAAVCAVATGVWSVRRGRAARDMLALWPP